MIRLPTKVEVDVYALLSKTIEDTLVSVDPDIWKAASPEQVHEWIMLSISEVFDFEEYYKD